MIQRILLQGLTTVIMLGLSLTLPGCTTTTTVRPYNPALQGDPESGVAVVEELEVVNDGESIVAKSAERLTADGFSYLAAGNPQLANIHFLAAIGKDPEKVWPYVGLGNIDFAAGEDRSALANYRKASALDSRNLPALLGQAQVLRRQGALNEAAELLARAMEISPNDPGVLNELAFVYESRGQGDLAAPLFRQIIENNPEQASAFNNLGVSQLLKGEYAEAIASFRQAQRLNSDDHTIKNNLATALALAGDETQALALFNSTIGEAAAWNNLGYLHMTRRRYTDAEKALRKAVELSPHYYSKAQENLELLDTLRQKER